MRMKEGRQVVAMTVARTSCAMGPTGATRARDANAVKKNGACRGARSSTGCRDASCRRRWNMRGSVYAIWWTGRDEPGAQPHAALVRG